MIYDEAAALLATHSSNLGYLPDGSDEAVRNALADPNAFRGNRMAQLKQATDELRSPDRRRRRREPERPSPRAIEGRKAELVASAFYEKATAEAQQSVARRGLTRRSRESRAENQVALILQIGTDFEASVYPSLLDQLAASATGRRQRSAPEANSLHQDSGRAWSLRRSRNRRLTSTSTSRALRAALLQTLNDGKRISL